MKIKAFIFSFTLLSSGNAEPLINNFGEFIVWATDMNQKIEVCD